MIGWWFCFKTTPIPSPEASHSNTNGWEKSGKARTRHDLITFFSRSNASCVVSVHAKAPFLARSVSGAASCEYPLKNLLYKYKYLRSSLIMLHFWKWANWERIQSSPIEFCFNFTNYCYYIRLTKTQYKYIFNLNKLTLSI